jgi:hypothetical protein
MLPPAAQMPSMILDRRPGNRDSTNKKRVRLRWPGFSEMVPDTFSFPFPPDPPLRAFVDSVSDGRKEKRNRHVLADTMSISAGIIRHDSGAPRCGRQPGRQDLPVSP